MYIYIYTYMYTYMYMYMYIYMYIKLQIHTCIRIYTHIYLYISIYICTHIYTYIYLYTYTYRYVDICFSHTQIPHIHTPSQTCSLSLTHTHAHIHVRAHTHTLCVSPSHTCEHWSWQQWTRHTIETLWVSTAIYLRTVSTYHHVQKHTFPHTVPKLHTHTHTHPAQALPACYAAHLVLQVNMGESFYQPVYHGGMAFVASMHQRCFPFLQAAASMTNVRSYYLQERESDWRERGKSMEGERELE